jgi:2-octaprenyl-6-methoxyphenol hydroxylase
MSPDYDLIIVGGGLAGNCLALALMNSGLKVAIVEAATREQLHKSPGGDRALALAYGSKLMLERLGIWQGIADKATAINNIHISDRGHFGKVRLSSAKQGVEALGYVITARDIESHVAGLVEKSAIPCYCPARVSGLIAGANQINVSIRMDNESVNLSSSVLAGADGGSSSIRNLLAIGQTITDYHQTALVTTVKSSLPNKNTAYERFTESGPLALLPIDNNHSSVVWTRSTVDAEALMTGSDAEFLSALQHAFGYRLGELALSAPRRAFPLSLIRADKMIANRAVIIGNAVHQLHPVAGQGFNLGLRDVMVLAEGLIKQQEQGQDCGEHHFLNQYAQSRQKDHDRVIGFTDKLVGIFSNDFLPLAALRNTGLSLLDINPVAKSLLCNYAMGLKT